MLTSGKDVEYFLLLGKPSGAAHPGHIERSFCQTIRAGK